MFVTGTAVFPDRGYDDFFIAGSELEEVLEMLAVLVKGGTHLLEASLEDTDDNWITLPVEAIDGQPLANQLKRLQGEWEDVLCP